MATAIAAAVVLTAGVVVVSRGGNNATGRVINAPDRARRAAVFRLGLRLSLTDAGGTTKFTESQAELDTEFGAEAERSHVTLPDVVGPNPLELVSQGTVLFVSIPPDRRAKVGDARWARVNAGSQAAAQGAGVGPLPDPLTVLLSLRGVDGPVRVVGHGKIDGVATTHYRGVVSVTQMAKRVPLSSGASVRAMHHIGPDQLAFDAWIDAHGLPRAVTLRARLAGKSRFGANLHIGEFGTPITIGLPGNDAVIAVASIREALALAGAA